MSFALGILPCRYGFLALPYHATVGFDYNRVYPTIAAVIHDFLLHGYTCEYKGKDVYMFTRTT